MLDHETTSSPEAPRGIDADGVTAWFTEHVEPCSPPLAFRLIAGGHSNLTFEVTDSASGHWVLRRPPLGQVLASAHDMGREHRIIAALARTEVPVAATHGLCDDEAVNGSPFYVMDFVDGTVVRSHAEAEALSPAQRAAAGESLVDVLAGIHSVDVDAAGLGDLGRKEDYIPRQLRRWHGQYEKSDQQVSGGLGIDGIGRAHDVLAARIPAQQGAAIVHGDYRLDNCMLAGDGTIAAVLDWELCTLGDPLADLGLLWVYWTDPGTEAVLPQASPTSLEGFPTKAELVARYAACSDRDLSALDYYVAFGYWKLACIIAGVYARYAGGAMGDAPPEQVHGFRAMLDALVAQTETAVDAIGSGSIAEVRA
jgi:aminoglycoside phosphotransferase (APT) family kinase protein